MIAGLIQPDSGKILFHGEPLEGPEDQLVPGHREIRLVHQDFKLHHRMTVAENMNNALLEYQADYRLERTDELLALCNITRIRDQYVHEISGGEKQRVAIAMALATEPEVLLFDEPFSNLDLVTKSILLQEIESIAKSTDTAIILITHDSRDAMEIADRMLVMSKGKPIRSGSPDQVYRDPKLETVANLVGLFTALSQEDMQSLALQAKNPAKTYGIWAESIHFDEGQMEGTIQKVIHMGPYNKVVLLFEGLHLWAYDFSKKLNVNQNVRFSIDEQEVFWLQ